MPACVLRPALVAAAAAVAASAAAADDASPPGYTLAHSGTVHDFEYFSGAWTTAQHRRKKRGVGSNDWEDFPATLCMTPYLGGLATVDEMYLPSKHLAGLTVRSLDLEKHQWLIHWWSSHDGKMDPGVVGGFQGDRGEFSGSDQDGGRPIKVRYVWTKLDQDHARWEQAFSCDDRTWEINWRADFTRADADKLCERGQPKGMNGGT